MRVNIRGRGGMYETMLPLINGDNIVKEKKTGLSTDARGSEASRGRNPWRLKRRQIRLFPPKWRRRLN